MKTIYTNFLCTFLLFLFLGSCSKDRLETMGIVKKEANQYAVSRKAPLEMPPDMYLRPPKTKTKNVNKMLSSKDNELSLDAILEDKVIPGIKKRKIINRQNIGKEQRIVNKILKTKATILLK